MKPRVQRPLTALPKRQRGAVLVLIVIALASILLMAALALDGGHMLVNKTRLQSAVDAAALSGAKTLSQVLGTGNASTLARDAALNTLTRNASATGNRELATAIGANVGSFAVVELASSVYGPFSFPGPADARYVRVSVPNYGLTGFFWGAAQSLPEWLGGNPDLPDKAVAAIATAGPSPTANPCDLVPLMVCGVPQAGTFWGYKLGELKVLKTAANNSSAIGPGNFQLLDFGSGGKSVGELLAGGGPVCPGKNVTTKPGNTVGPSVTGLNTRFGEYKGSFHGSQGTYPPDQVISFDPITYNDKSSPPRLEYQGQPVTSSDAGYLTAGGTPVLGYPEWKQNVGNCPSGCESNGVAERRILKVVIGDCTGKNSGSSSIPVLGFGCFFLVRPSDHSGQEAQIFGQFVKECEGDGVAGPKPVEDVGPLIIQLYKTYLNGVSTPSTDS